MLLSIRRLLLLLLILWLLLVLALVLLLLRWCRERSGRHCDALRHRQLPQTRVLHLQSGSSGVVAVAHATGTQGVSGARIARRGLVCCCVVMARPPQRAA